MVKHAVRIALIAKPDIEREFCQALVREVGGISMETYISLSQFRHGCRAHAYSGMLVDLYTLITASTDDREFFFSLEESFPILLVRCSTETSEPISLSSPHQLGISGNRDSVLKFLRIDCRNQPARYVRAFPRREVSLPIHIWLDSIDSPLPSRILNISLGGCFLLDPQGKVQTNRPLLMVIDGITDKTPIPCHPRWMKDWKENDHVIQGVGTEFERLSLPQAEEIRDVVRRGAFPKPH